jgi:hypothetical protein
MSAIRINLGDEPVKEVVAEKTIRTFDGPGRGRKQCDSCGIYIGVRTKVCSCGHNFLRKKPKVVEVRKKRVARKGASPEPETEVESDDVVVIPRGFTTNVIAPAGKCPVQLKGMDKETVEEWATKVRSYGEKSGDYYSTEALKYFVRYVHNIASEEYKKIGEILDSMEG